MRRMVFILVSGFCVGVSSADEFRDSGLPSRLGKMKVEKKYWSMNADEAALELANQFTEEGVTVKLEEKVKPISSGFMTYSGWFNFQSKYDRLVRFGDGAVEYQVKFYDAHSDYYEKIYDENKSYFVCTKSSVSDELTKACEIIQHFNGMKRVKNDSAISGDFIYSTPPTFYKNVKVFDSEGKEREFRAGGRNLKNKASLESIFEDHTWASEYAEVVLKNAQEFNKDSVKRASNIAGERAELVKNLRVIIGMEGVPASFLLVVIEGIDKTLLHELEEDLKLHSKKMPPVREYVREYYRLGLERTELDTYELGESKDKDDVIYQKLSSQFHKDKEQQLRAKLDQAISNLDAIGDENRIGLLIDQGQDVGHLLYDIYFKDKLAFDRLGLRRLEKAKFTSDHHTYIRNMIEAGRDDAVFGFLEKTTDEKFSICCAQMVDHIRKKKPEWKGRLQAGLLDYVRNNKYPTMMIYNAFENLMPEDDPDYFDMKLVGECLFDPEIKKRIIGNEYMRDEKMYEKLVFRWKKISGGNE